MSIAENNIIAGKYQVIRELGQGSFGIVYLVQHIDLNVEYALKILKNCNEGDASFLDGFKQEAEILLKFSHPGVVQFRDFGRTEDGIYYMALDYCKGEILEDLILKQGAFPVELALQIMLQILDVLEAAHTRSIVHRDIKSNNIMLDWVDDGTIVVKVLDFGIATLRAETSADSKSTTERMAVGTPEYMSPEQASGEDDIDHRTDIYSAGVLMYEMLSGSLPFRSPSLMQILLKHLTQEVPPFELELGIPNFIFGLVNNAMAKQKENRFQTAGEFKAACQQALQQVRSQSESESYELDAAVIRATRHAAADAARPSIVCLDDNPMILEIVKYVFEKEGYIVNCVQSFSMVHDYIFEEHAALLLCDVNMPGLPGSKICRMLKQATTQLKIILFSNIDERDLEKLAVASRADAWISKNTSPQNWLDKVREVMGEGT